MFEQYLISLHSAFAEDPAGIEMAGPLTWNILLVDGLLTIFV